MMFVVGAACGTSSDPKSSDPPPEPLTGGGGGSPMSRAAAPGLSCETGLVMFESEQAARNAATPTTARNRFIGRTSVVVMPASAPAAYSTAQRSELLSRAGNG